MGLRVDLDAAGVEVSFTGADRWLALSRGVSLPTARILGARVLTRRAAVASCPRWRLVPVGWPGVLRAGSFGMGQYRQLWLVHRAEHVLAIYLRGEPYHRVVLEVDDPEKMSRMINRSVPGVLRPRRTRRDRRACSP